MLFRSVSQSRYRAWTGSQLIIGGLETANKYELDAIYNGLSVGLQQWELESLDTLRDNILTTKGNVTSNVTGANSIPVLQQFNERLGDLSRTEPC